MARIGPVGRQRSSLQTGTWSDPGVEEAGPDTPVIAAIERSAEEVVRHLVGHDEQS